jgi:hypothetical protein
VYTPHYGNWQAFPLTAVKVSVEEQDAAAEKYSPKWLTNETKDNIQPLG